MTHSGRLRLRSPEGLAEMQNVVVDRLSAGAISAAEALAALQSLTRLSVDADTPQRPVPAARRHLAAATAAGEM